MRGARELLRIEGMRTGSRVWLFVAGLLFAACHPQAEQARSGTPARASRPPIAQRCPELLVPRAASSAPPRVFLEVAQIIGDVAAPVTSSPAATPPSPFDDPRLEVPRVAHVIGTSDVASMLAWDTPGPTPALGSEPQRWDLRLTPHLETTGSGSLRLELDLAPAPPLGTPPEAWSIPEHRRVHTAVVIGEQQPVVLALPRGAGARGPSWMVVTPYLIREEADLRRLFQCKMRERQRAAG
jgi:hypothetical protein